MNEGTGGTKETVEGVDIWRDGTPPRKFKMIGVIDDVRRDSWMAGSGKKSLAKKAAEVGGDAIIILDSRREVVGHYNPGRSGTATTTGTFYGSGNTTMYQGQTTYQTGGSTSTAIRDKITKAAVIKYLD